MTTSIEEINYKLILDLYEKCFIDFIYSKNDFRYSIDQNHPELELVKSKGLFEGMRTLAKRTYEEWTKLAFDEKSLIVRPEPCGTCENCVHRKGCKETGCIWCDCYTCNLISEFEENEMDFNADICYCVNIGSVVHCLHGENADKYRKYIMDTYKQFVENCHEQCLVKSAVSD